MDGEFGAAFAAEKGEVDDSGPGFDIEMAEAAISEIFPSSDGGGAAAVSSDGGDS